MVTKSRQLGNPTLDVSPDELTVEMTTGTGCRREEIIQSFACQWLDLCEETRSAPFHRPEWIAAYLSTFEPASELVLLTVKQGDQLVAVLPLIRKKCFYAGVPLVKLSGAANIHSVRFEILRSASPAGDASVQALWNYLKRMTGWHALELMFFSQDGACTELFEKASKDGYLTRVLPIHESPILRLIPDDDGTLSWLTFTSRHFRHELRRYARVLESQMGAKPTITRSIYPDPENMERFFDLEAAGWKGRKGSAINCEPKTRAFYEQIARLGSEAGYFCLHSLEVNGVMAAAAFSVMTPDCFYPMKVAFNEDLRRAGPGHLLFNSILEECAERQIPSFFFGGSNDPYKNLWTQETLPYFGGVIFAPSLRSRLAYQSKTRLFPKLGELRRRFRHYLEHSDSQSNATDAVNKTDTATVSHPQH